MIVPNRVVLLRPTHVIERAKGQATGTSPKQASCSRAKAGLFVFVFDFFVEFRGTTSSTTSSMHNKANQSFQVAKIDSFQFPCDYYTNPSTKGLPSLDQISRPKDSPSPITRPNLSTKGLPITRPNLSTKGLPSLDQISRPKDSPHSTKPLDQNNQVVVVL